MTLTGNVIAAVPSREPLPGEPTKAATFADTFPALVAWRRLGGRDRGALWRAAAWEQTAVHAAAEGAFAYADRCRRVATEIMAGERR